MAQRIFKNQTASIIYIDDLGAKQVPAYGQIDLAQNYTLPQLSNSEDLAIALMSDIDSNGFSQNLILNDGIIDLKATNGVDLLRNLSQRTNQTVDGDWKVVVKSQSVISENKVVDKSVSVTMDALAKYDARFYIPNGKTWVIESFGGGSDYGTARICLKYHNEEGCVDNLFVDPQHDYDTTLNQESEAADLTLFVNNTNGELDGMDKQKCYKFANYNDPSIVFTRKIVDIDTGNNSVTIDAAIGEILPVGSYLALTEKPIRSIIIEKITNVLAFSSPIVLTGTGANSLCLYLYNLDEVEDSAITAFFNGYEKPTGE